MLLNPAEYSRAHNAERARDIALKTIQLCAQKGLARIKADDQAMV